MRTFHGRRTRTRADAPACPWATGAVLTCCAATELALVPWHSWVIAVSVLMAAVSGLAACYTLGRRRVLPPVAVVAGGAVLGAGPADRDGAAAGGRGRRPARVSSGSRRPVTRPAWVTPHEVTPRVVTSRTWQG